MKQEPVETHDANRRARIMTWIKRVLGGFFIFLVLLIVFLQFSFVQTYLSTKITDYISAKTDTEIYAKKLKINPFKGIILEDFSILDNRKDTIAKIGALHLSLYKNLFYLLSNRLDLSYLGVKDFRLNIEIKEGRLDSNLQDFINKLVGTNDKAKDGSSLLLNVKKVELSDIFIRIRDENGGVEKVMSLASGIFKVDYMDLDCMDFDLQEVVLDRPVYTTTIFNYECKISDEIKEWQSDLPKQEGLPHLSVLLKELVLRNGYFGRKNMLLPLASDQSYLDYDNFHIEDINLLLTDLRMLNLEDITARLDGLSARDNTGFTVHNIMSDSIIIQPGSIQFKDFEVDLGNTIVKNQFALRFRDFESFKNFGEEVFLNAALKESKVRLGDLAHFVKNLGHSSFFVNNEDEMMHISGIYSGRINSLRGNDVEINIGDKLYLEGSFSTRDLLDANNTLLNIKLDRFATSMRKIKMLIPHFNPPDNFYKLGNILFKGRFDGFLEDFVAFGSLTSDVGTANLDMKLDISQGTRNAKYRGMLALKQFDLGRWSGNPDFGLVNFNSRVEEGIGLTLNTVKANLTASIQSLLFKNYHYKNIELDGKIDKNTFNGTLKSDDENFDFVFDGTLEYLNKKAFFNFKSKINNIDLHALHLVDHPLKVQADMDIDLSGSNINNFIGDLQLKGLHVNFKDSIYRLNELAISSKDLVTGGRELYIESELGTLMVNGQYDLPNIIPSLKQLIFSNYSQFTKLWKVDVAKIAGDQRFDFNINLRHSRNFLELANLNNTYFNQLSLKGRLDTYKNELSVASEIPFLKFQNQQFEKIQLYVNSDIKTGSVILHIDTTYALNRKFNPIDIVSNIKNDTLRFEVSSEKIIDSLENLDVKGAFVPDPRGYKLKLAENEIVFLGTEWSLNKDNDVVFGEKYLNIENLTITDGVRTIELNDINDHQGISLDLENFDVNLLNAFSKYEKLILKGQTRISARVFNVFEKDKELSAYISIPEFTINNDHYGSIFIDVTKQKSQPLRTNINIGDFIAVIGTYSMDDKMLDLRAKLRRAPMKIIGYLLKDGIRNTHGNIDADITLSGPLSTLKLDGSGIVKEGQTTIIYTGVTYFFDNQSIKISNNEINLDGVVITDANGSKGTVRGALTHNLFRDFGVNATISGTNVIGINTTRADNPDYYGFGIGDITAEFKGHFDNVDMRISAVTGPGTKLFIPISNAQSSVDKSFIKFVKRDSTSKSVIQQEKAISGIDIEISMVLTPDAEMSLIFDEVKGDIIKGRGRGNLKMDIKRGGDFEIFGDYEIESGQYLFTAPLIPVAKPFIVERGSRIFWTGDPINATLDITAKYRTRTAVEPFISEYLTGIDNEQLTLARQNTEVDVELYLGGSLYRPEIKFGLEFPNLTGDIANLTDSKLRVLQGNDQELNGQVLGLIVFNSFIQSNRVSDVFGASGFQSASISTLSEFLSSQLSMYITSIINSVVGEGSIISGVDFDVNVRNNTFGLNNNGFVPDEIAVKNTFVFKNDRLSLDIGGNYVFQFQGIPVNQVLPDFALEFRLTEDRKLKIRMYGKYDIDVSTVGLREKYGLGVAYRTEFGSMTEFEDLLIKAVNTTIK